MSRRNMVPFMQMVTFFALAIAVPSPSDSVSMAFAMVGIAIFPTKVSGLMFCCDKIDGYSDVKSIDTTQ